jgi:hypothetical protein
MFKPIRAVVLTAFCAVSSITGFDPEESVAKRSSK